MLLLADKAPHRSALIPLFNPAGSQSRLLAGLTASAAPPPLQPHVLRPGIVGNARVLCS